jgi:hypothetical protein
MTYLSAAICLAILTAPALAQSAPPARLAGAPVDQVAPPRASHPIGAKADYHVHPKGGLTVEDALRRSRETGIYYGLAINGGLGQPAENDAALEAFLRELDGKPVYKAMQAEGREWVRMFSKATLEKFDYVFTDSMTWTDDAGKRMRLWIPEEVGAIADPQRFMDTLVDRTLGILATEPVDIYVNSTYIPDQLNAQYDALWTPARMRKIVDGLAANGVAMEINNRRRIPSAAFIRLAKQAGVKFTCGTNNAGADDLGRNEYCAEMIRACELRPEHFWTPPADGAKAVQRRPLPR